ncbi:hypothetical protein K2Z83_28185 [Oscillochloris sp. ZM17-4]|uniref:hypothetical protein n=1 Tax=Oscillochloris sp. ZM17-4 TaxID=2866714 RepID=UPI001C732526|nr:hypothetical protein [Oscillochloris sp. ZM17-4]MBX0331535.1 hypothetical protein [Oscillochloris sp. ZM17-4]
MPTQDEIDQQLSRLQTYRATLAHYLDQVSLLGAAHTPPGVAHGVREARQGIARCKAALRGWGLAAEGHPDDEDSPPRRWAPPRSSASYAPPCPPRRRPRPPAWPAC